MKFFDRLFSGSKGEEAELPKKEPGIPKPEEHPSPINKPEYSFQISDASPGRRIMTITNGGGIRDKITREIFSAIFNGGFPAWGQTIGAQGKDYQVEIPSNATSEQIDRFIREITDLGSV